MLESGLTFNFWSAGMTVYGVCVLLANAVILKMTNNYTGVGELMILFQCTAFWLTVNLETRHPAFRNLYKLWSEFVGSAAAWLGLIMSVLTIFSLDLAVKILFRILVNKVRGLKVDYDKNLLFEAGQNDVKKEEFEQIIKEQFQRQETTSTVTYVHKIRQTLTFI